MISVIIGLTLATAYTLGSLYWAVHLDMDGVIIKLIKYKRILLFDLIFSIFFFTGTIFALVLMVLGKCIDYVRELIYNKNLNKEIHFGKNKK